MKVNLNHLISSFCLIATLVATGCSDEHEYASDHSFYDDVKVKIDNVDKKNVLSVQLADETYALSVTVTPEALSFNPMSYIYEVGDNSIATINKNGLLTLLKPGETTLTVKYGSGKSISANCTLKVVASLIRDLVVNSEVIIGTEEPVDLTEYISVLPWSADIRAMSYKVQSGYEDVVEIVGGSVVQGLSAGEAIVEVRSTDGLEVTKNLKLVVKGSTPITDIKLNDEGEKISSGTLLVGQEVELASLVNILPENAADKRLKYEIVSGADCISISDAGILTTTAGGEAEIRISPLDEELNIGVTPCPLKLTIKSWNERENWKVSTSITYSNGQNYVLDNAKDASGQSIQTGRPEEILDDNSYTYLSLVKPGKSYGNDYKAEGKDVPVYFTVDMGMPQTINYFTWGHRISNTQSYLRVWGISLFGSNDGVSFNEIQANIEINRTMNELMDFDIPQSTYRYIKIQYVDWSDLHPDEPNSSMGGTMQVAEFNVGKK